MNNTKCGIVIGKERMDTLISGGESAMNIFWVILQEVAPKKIKKKSMIIK